MKARSKIRSCFFQKKLFFYSVIKIKRVKAIKRSKCKHLGIHNGAMGVGKILILIETTNYMASLYYEGVYVDPAHAMMKA